MSFKVDVVCEWAEHGDCPEFLCIDTVFRYIPLEQRKPESCQSVARAQAKCGIPSQNICRNQKAVGVMCLGTHDSQLLRKIMNFKVIYVFMCNVWYPSISAGDNSKSFR